MTTIWRRHPALERLVTVWPELERGGDQPPPRELLAELLDRVGWSLASQAEARAGYEATVVEGRIPTREGSWHDVFNSLAFVSFPRSKAALHRRCFDLQLARARQPPRSREEDALTLIDEASLVVAGSAEGVTEFDRLRPTRSLVELDRVVRAHQLHVHVFGHALYEHLALDRPPINAGVVTVVVAGDDSHAEFDRTLAERIRDGGFPSPKMGASLTWPDPIVDAWLAPIPASTSAR